MDWLKMTYGKVHVDCGYSIPCFMSPISQLSSVYFCLMNYVIVHHHIGKTVLKIINVIYLEDIAEP